MDLFRISMTAGQRVQLSQKGRFFRLLEGEGDIRLEASNGVDSKIITGIGVDMRSEDGQGFDWFALTSETTQVVAVMVSNLPTTDSRLSGVININQMPAMDVATLPDIVIGAMPAVDNVRPSQWVQGTTALYTNSGRQLLPQRATRFSATIQADVDMWVGPTSAVNSTNGIRVNRGETLNIENTGALYGRAIDVSGSARVMESVQ